MAGKQKHVVMISSTYEELAEHREAAQHAMLGQHLFPAAMENDAALPEHDLISASLEKVDEADAYVGLISYRYGHVQVCTDRNPDKLSLTELEFRRAVERKIPICMFIMHGDHPVPMRAIYEETDAEKQKLTAFIALAQKDRIYVEFKSLDDLKTKTVQSLVNLREAIEKRPKPSVPLLEPSGMARKMLDVDPGWNIVDQDALAKIRENPPSLNMMVQFFDGILPTWRLALAPGVQPRIVAERLANRLRAAHAGAAKPQVLLLAGAGGEGKSTAVLHAAAALVEDTGQAWTCLHRQAANAKLPEDAFSKLPIEEGHAWVVVIDDADNIGPAILVAVKKIAARTDVHLLLAARDAEWHVKRLVPRMWQPAANFYTEHLAGLDREDARRIVAGWTAWGDEAMGRLKSRSEAAAINELLAHASDFATRHESGELLGALLMTRQGEDMRAHVRTLVSGLDRNPVIKTYSLSDVYAIIAAMHAENQLYLSRSVLAFALCCDIDELESKALVPLRREAMLEPGDTYLLTRHRRIAEVACAVMREDEEDIDRWYPSLARAAVQSFKRNGFVIDLGDWNFALASHFVKKGERWWSIARNVAKTVYEAGPSNHHYLTAYASVLRRTGQAADAMAMLKAAGERFRDRRNVLYEWSTVAGAAGDRGLSTWLSGRSLADGGDPIDPMQCKFSLAGLGVAFRELSATSHEKAFAAGQAACGQLGLRLEDLDPTSRGYFEKHAAEGCRNNIGELLPEQAVDALRKAVILGAYEVEQHNEPVFFEKLLGEPDGYRYTALLRMVEGAKTSSALQRTKEKLGRRK